MNSGGVEQREYRRRQRARNEVTEVLSDQATKLPRTRNSDAQTRLRGHAC
jgi:hypothetical protein